jgi:hypothetical protein
VQVTFKGKAHTLQGRVELLVAWLVENQQRVNLASPLQLTFHAGFAGGSKSRKVTVKLLDEEDVGVEILAGNDC